MFLKGKSVTIKLIKVVENNLFEAGRFVVHFTDGEQDSEIFTKIGKVVGKASFKVTTDVVEKEGRQLATTSEDKENIG